MEGVSLKSRAVAFAFSAGAVSFILAILATCDADPTPAQLTAAVIVALVCGVLTWASAERCLGGLATAIDAAAVRIADAAGGDLTSPTPSQLRDELPDLSRALDSMFDQVRATLDDAQTLAMYDPVTSLANRTHFRREAEQLLQAGSAGAALLAFIDLDHFKAVNDTHGHAHGDQLLARVAKRLLAIASDVGTRARQSGGEKAEAIVGRLSGDEFTVFFPTVGSRDEAIALGNAILAALTRPFDLGGREVAIGASIGLALHPEHGGMLPALMRAADVAMYRAKAAGRGRVQMFDEAMTRRIDERRLLDDALRRAVTDDEFGFAYQPRMRLTDGRITVAEATLRWEHPAGHIRPLASFLGPAEESGLIVEIGNWAIERLSARLADWPAHSLSPRLGVPISKRQAVQPDYFDRVRRSVAAHGAAISSIEFRISEAVVTTCSSAVTDQLGALRRDGASILIDGFGGGSSNLSRLRALPVDHIRLHPTLTEPLERDLASRAVVQALIALVHGLGATAVAEGVDTAGQLDLLRVMGCDAVQGSAVAPPMTEADYRLWNTTDRMRA